jgi:SRSO17 transposase
LAWQADRLIGGSDAFLVINNTSLPKKGEHSVRVAPQYASMLGKAAEAMLTEAKWKAAGGAASKVL